MVTGSTDVLIRVLVDERVDLLLGPLRLFEEDIVMNGASGTLGGGVSAQVEVILEGPSDAGLDECTRKRIGVLVTSAPREEADVMTLGSDDDQESGHNVDLGEDLLHGSDLLVDDLRGLTLGNTIAEVDNSGRRLSLSNLSRPAVLDERDDVLLNFLIGDHLDAVAIGFNSGSVASGVSVH